MTKSLDKAGLPSDARKEADKQFTPSRLPCTATRRKPAVVRTYLDWLAELPWKKIVARISLDIVKAKDVLDEDHYGLDQDQGPHP